MNERNQPSLDGCNTVEAEAADDGRQAKDERVADAQPKRPTWEELMRDPEYNAAMQQTVRARLRAARGAEDPERGRARLEAQSAELRRLLPQFDLEQELKDPTFRRMTQAGVPLRDAFCVVHFRQLQAAAMQVAAQEAAERLARSIRSASARPRENGISGRAASVSDVDWRCASRQEREDFKRRVRTAAAQGQKLYPAR